MFFELHDKELRAIEPDEITAQHPVVGYITLEELETLYQRLGFAPATVSQLQLDSNTVRSTIDEYEDYSFGVINIVDTGNVQGSRDRIGLYLRRNLFLLVDAVDEDKSTRAHFDYVLERYSGQPATLEKMMYCFFERLIYNDNKALEAMEFRVSELEEQLEENARNRGFNLELLQMKKDALLLRSYYEQLIDIGESIQENENEIFSKGVIRYLKMFTDKVQRLSNEAQQLRENLVQLREAYQASMDYDLNRIMKIFTVVTTVFLPLTLIVGWYGMNFTNMPELT